MEPHLCPCKDPRNRPQRANTGVLLAAVGPRSDVEPTELPNWRTAPEEVNELGVLKHQPAVGIARDLGHCLHDLPPLRLGLVQRREPVLEHGARVQVQRPEADLLLAKLLLDDLALDRDAELPIDRALRLAQHCQVRRRASAPNGASAAVEERELHAVLLREGREVFLRLEQRPRCRQAARVLARVGVPNHALLLALNALHVRRVFKQGPHGPAGVVKVIERLKQRDHPHVEVRQPAFPHEELHAHDVARRARHADHVCSERVLGQGREHPERVDDILLVLAEFHARG
mmetsp:Transcript_29185/g.69686  ORF Transcript_29185/g.69686 Transcript_29185/m.69686 type:complete len:288 (-) Transcript_29185:427-1290(-)